MSSQSTSKRGDSVMGRLRDEMQADLELRGLSLKTQKIYLGQARDFAVYFNRSPEQLGESEVKEYLLHMIREKKASGSSINQCYSALRFLYQTTLKRDWVVDRIPYPKTHRRLPVVLDRTEVESLFSVTHNLKHRAILLYIP
jgi:site-specific recombinase XerD